MRGFFGSGDSIAKGGRGRGEEGGGVCSETILIKRGKQRGNELGKHFHIVGEG